MLPPDRAGKGPRPTLVGLDGPVWRTDEDRESRSPTIGASRTCTTDEPGLAVLAGKPLESEFIIFTRRVPGSIAEQLSELPRPWSLDSRLDRRAQLYVARVWALVELLEHAASAARVRHRPTPNGLRVNGCISAPGARPIMYHAM